MNTEPVSYVTASDLADMMQEYGESGFQYPLCMELKYVAVMLRQQQAEIEALKNAKRFIQNFAEEQHQRAVALEMRELTDEEIMEVVEKIECTYDPMELETSYDYEFRIAKTILRKAQEK